MEGFLRPEVELLPESAAIPDKNLISPAPNQFTHQLTRSQQYYFRDANPSLRPDGELPPGTKVVLLRYDGGRYCCVVDGRGLYVQVEHSGIEKMG
jgi:hypothetical protein